MPRKNTSRKDHSKKAGLIAFGATLIAYSLLFPFHSVGHFIIGGSLAAAAGWVVKTMATPLKGLDKHAKAKSAMDVNIIEDEYTRSVVEKGVEMLDAFKAERIAINEHVFTRRIDQVREKLDKVLRSIIDDPDNASRIRKMNSYYLPTALKLLESYRSAKQQGASYMAVSATREDVLSMLDQLIDALNQVQDAMLKDDLEDMDIEIDVFEQMLEADGLKENEVTESLRQSAHEAAREIPLSQAPTVKPTGSRQTVAKPVPMPAEPEHHPETITLNVPEQPSKPASAPVPCLKVPGTTASARQMAEGTPILQMPASPAAPDFSSTIHHESDA